MLLTYLFSIPHIGKNTNDMHRGELPERHNLHQGLIRIRQIPAGAMAEAWRHRPALAEKVYERRRTRYAYA
jgi:hypothetical protein